MLHWAASKYPSCPVLPCAENKQDGTSSPNPAGRFNSNCEGVTHFLSMHWNYSAHFTLQLSICIFRICLRCCIWGQNGWLQQIKTRANKANRPLMFKILSQKAFSIISSEDKQSCWSDKNSTAILWALGFVLFFHYLSALEWKNDLSKCKCGKNILGKSVVNLC